MNFVIVKRQIDETRLLKARLKEAKIEASLVMQLASKLEDRGLMRRDFVGIDGLGRRRENSVPAAPPSTH
jgi:hypothetical protein